MLRPRLCILQECTFCYLGKLFKSHTYYVLDFTNKRCICTFRRLTQRRLDMYRAGRPRQKRRPRRRIIENLQVLRDLGRQVGKAGRQQYHGRSSGWRRLHDSAMLVAMSRPDASPRIGLCSSLPTVAAQVQTLALDLPPKPVARAVVTRASTPPSRRSALALVETQVETQAVGQTLADRRHSAAQTPRTSSPASPLAVPLRQSDAWLGWCWVQYQPCLPCGFACGPTGVMG